MSEYYFGPNSHIFFRSLPARKERPLINVEQCSLPCLKLLNVRCLSGCALQGKRNQHSSNRFLLTHTEWHWHCAGKDWHWLQMSCRRSREQQGVMGASYSSMSKNISALILVCQNKPGWYMGKDIPSSRSWPHGNLLLATTALITLSLTFLELIYAEPHHLSTPCQSRSIPVAFALL